LSLEPNLDLGPYQRSQIGIYKISSSCLTAVLHLTSPNLVVIRIMRRSAYCLWSPERR